MGNDVGHITRSCMRWYVRKKYLTWVKKKTEIPVWCARMGCTCTSALRITLSLQILKTLMNCVMRHFIWTRLEVSSIQRAGAYLTGIKYTAKIFKGTLRILPLITIQSHS